MKRKEDVAGALNMVAGNFSKITHPIKVLFDLGAIRSFMSSRLVKILWSVPISTHSLLTIALPNGKVVNY